MGEETSVPGAKILPTWQGPRWPPIYCQGGVIKEERVGLKACHTAPGKGAIPAFDAEWCVCVNEGVHKQTLCRP